MRREETLTEASVWRLSGMNNQPPNPPNGGLKKKIRPKVPQMGDLGVDSIGRDGGRRQEILWRRCDMNNTYILTVKKRQLHGAFLKTI